MKGVIKQTFSAAKQILFFYFSGQQIISDHTHKIVVKEDGTLSLIIVPAMPHDSGEWTVVAQNRAGRSSISVNLTVDGRVQLLCISARCLLCHHALGNMPI